MCWVIGNSLTFCLLSELKKPVKQKNINTVLVTQCSTKLSYSCSLCDGCFSENIAIFERCLQNIDTLLGFCSGHLLEKERLLLSMISAMEKAKLHQLR